MHGLKRLGNEELLKKTESLVAEERKLGLEVLAHLREIEHRKLYCSLKLGSLFEYATKILKYSPGAAQRRISAMWLIQDLPEVEGKLQTGELNLTTVSMAQQFAWEEKYTKEEKRELVQSFSGLSKRECERELVKRSPESVLPDRARVITEELTELRFTVTQKQLKKLEKIKGLLAHKNPNPSYADLFEMLSDLALKKLDPEQQTSRTTPPAESPMRTPPVTMKREIWKIAQGKCQNCGNTYALQSDHKTPWALGGRTKPDNLRILCRACNQWAAIQRLGLNFMRSRPLKNRATCRK